MIKQINVGSIVKFVEFKGSGGYYKVWSIRGGKANLGVIFGKRHLYHKGISLAELVECQDEWYAKWQQTDTYKCM